MIVRLRVDIELFSFHDSSAVALMKGGPTNNKARLWLLRQEWHRSCIQGYERLRDFILCDPLEITDNVEDERDMRAHDSYSVQAQISMAVIFKGRTAPYASCRLQQAVDINSL